MTRACTEIVEAAEFVALRTAVDRSTYFVPSLGAALLTLALSFRAGIFGISATAATGWVWVVNMLEAARAEGAVAPVRLFDVC